jgi:hypothetical protein
VYDSAHPPNILCICNLQYCRIISYRIILNCPRNDIDITRLMILGVIYELNGTLCVETTSVLLSVCDIESAVRPMPDFGEIRCSMSLQTLSRNYEFRKKKIGSVTFILKGINEFQLLLSILLVRFR